MTSPKPPAPAPRSPDTLLPYDAFDPIPQPEVTEKSSETTWQLFNEIRDKEHARFADTVPQARSTPRADSRVPGAPLRPAAQAGASGLEKLADESRRNNRVCPQPARWAELDAILRAAAPGAAASLAPPLAAREWKTTTPLAKRLMFRAVVDWAAQHGAVEPALQFVRALPEDQWHHMGD